VTGPSGRTFNQNKHALTNQPVGIYFCSQPSTEQPTYFVDRDEARQMRDDKRGYFINHGKDLRLLADQEVDESEKDANATAWETVQRSRIPFGMAQRLGIRGRWLTVTTKQFEPYRPARKQEPAYAG
jgi:hypothetical protein